MLPLVKELQWKEVRAGLTENPDLIGVRDTSETQWNSCHYHAESEGSFAERRVIRKLET